MIVFLCCGLKSILGFNEVRMEILNKVSSVVKVIEIHKNSGFVFIWKEDVPLVAREGLLFTPDWNLLISGMKI